MNNLNADLARAIVAERLAAADQRRLINEVKRARKMNRPKRLKGSPGPWLQRLVRLRSVDPEVAPAASGPRPRPLVVDSGPGAARQPAAELSAFLDHVAGQIVEHGTRSAAATLAVISSAVRHVSPGAAAALVDWEGSEIARLRAFGVVHSVAMETLDTTAQRVLLDRIHGSGPAIDLPIAG